MVPAGRNAEEIAPFHDLAQPANADRERGRVVIGQEMGHRCKTDRLRRLRRRGDDRLWHRNVLPAQRVMLANHVIDVASLVGDPGNVQRPVEHLARRPARRIVRGHENTALQSGLGHSLS